MVWNLLPAISAPMSFQMALDSLLFQKMKEDPAAPPMIRFYYASEPWITTGCSFRSEREASRSELIKKNPKVPVAKRLTGGGCVLHGEDLIFSLIIRMDQDPERLGRVQVSYKTIHECVASAFQELGVAPNFYQETDELPKGDDCFTYPVASDLSWKDKKIAGGAQKRSEGVLLHHESIVIPEGISVSVLMKAIQVAFEEQLGITFEETRFDNEIFFNAANGLKTIDQRPKVDV